MPPQSGAITTLWIASYMPSHTWTLPPTHVIPAGPLRVKHTIVFGTIALVQLVRVVSCLTTVPDMSSPPFELSTAEAEPVYAARLAVFTVILGVPACSAAM